MNHQIEELKKEKAQIETEIRTKISEMCEKYGISNASVSGSYHSHGNGCYKCSSSTFSIKLDI